MSELIQITTPAAPRDYGSMNQGSRQHNIEQNASGQVFDLGNQTQVVKTNDRSQDQAQQNLKDESGAVLFKAPADTVRNPASALNTAKALLSSETIALIQESGNTDTLNKITEFASEVMLTPETLVKDMTAQQKGSTIFGDKLWNTLKTMIDMSGSKEFESAVADFAKAAADLSAKDEILKSLSANFKFLAGEAAPSKAVSDELLSASKALIGSDAQMNFTALKPTLLKLLEYTERSLLLNDDTKNLLPLIIHNMSRYSDNASALKESFDSLVKMAEGLNFTQSQLEEIFGKPMEPMEPAEYTAAAKVTQGGKENLKEAAPQQGTAAADTAQNHNESHSAARKLHGQPEQAAEKGSIPEPQQQKIPDRTDSRIPQNRQDGSAEQNSRIFANKQENPMAEQTEQMKQTEQSVLPQSDFAAHRKRPAEIPPQLRQTVSSDMYTPRQTPVQKELEKLFDSYVSKNEYLPSDSRQTLMFGKDSAAKEAQIRSSVNLLAAGAKHMASRISPDTLTSLLNTVDFSQGETALHHTLGALIPNTPAMRTALQSIFDDLEETGDLDIMVERLNSILENIDSKDSENMVKLAQGLNSALNEMASSGKYSCTASTSMETLADFLTKNINSSFLHSLSGMDRSEMVQNMITAPGVFTPLIHHFIPLDAFGIRAFGEMWVDPNADELKELKHKKGSGGEAGSHMFVCFDVEGTGYFELEIYEQNKNLSVMLLCPEKAAEYFEPMKEIIPKIAAENGYKASASIIDKIKGKRSLDQVFPKLAEQRSGLNVKV